MNTIGFYPQQRRSRPGPVTAAWCRYWFAPQTPTNLGWCRVLFCGLMFWYFVGQDLSSWALLPQNLFQPVWIFAKLHLPVLSPAVMRVLAGVWKVSLLLACVGLFTRISTAVAAGLSVYMIGLGYNYGKVEHMGAIAILALGILACSRCGDGVSLDRLIARRRGRPAAKPGGEYRWPIRAVWLVMAMIFLSAGIAKLKNNGFSWVLSDTFGNILVARNYDAVERPILNWGLFIARHPWLSIPMGSASLLGELFLPLALFSRRARAVLPAVMFAMQVGIGLVMGIWFTTFLFVYVFWVPWDHLPGFPTPTAAEPAELTEPVAV